MKQLCARLASSRDGELGAGGQLEHISNTCRIGLFCVADDRVGGWQHMYRLLQNGGWQVADSCPMLIEAIPTRMHDNKKPGDLRKIPGDPYLAESMTSSSGLSTFLTPEEEPLTLRQGEALRDMAQAGELTSAAIRYEQWTQEANPPRGPEPMVFIGRHGRYIAWRALSRRRGYGR